MNANDITFGIEMETTLPASDPCRVGGHRAGLQVPWLPAGWLADGDPSIRVGPNRKPCEFISPILKGPEGVAQLVQAKGRQGLWNLTGEVATVVSSCYNNE